MFVWINIVVIMVRYLLLISSQIYFMTLNLILIIEILLKVFEDILVRDGEMVCVELVAADKEGDLQSVIFLGSIHYDAVKRVYDARVNWIFSFLNYV